MTTERVVCPVCRNNRWETWDDGEGLVLWCYYCGFKLKTKLQAGKQNKRLIRELVYPAPLSALFGDSIKME